MTTAIVLMTYGEPTANRFADQWMYSYRILRSLTRKIAAIPVPLLPVIATSRAFGRCAAWREHDFTSPLEPATERVRDALADRVNGPVAIAYEFRRPLLSEVLPGLRDRGADRFLIVPMYFGTGDFTCGMTELAVADARRALRWLRPEHIALCRLTEPSWVDAWAEVSADFVRRGCRERGIALPADDWALCLAAHGSVQAPGPGVDNGVASFGELLWRIFTRLEGDFGRVRNAWLNHTRGGRWTEPSVAQQLRRLQAAGYRKLVYYSWGFTTSNAESALEGRLALAELESAFEQVAYLPCLDDDPAGVDLLARRVSAALATSFAEPVGAAR